jgi:uncharacterized protein involved in type VI secretion and phage assembly
MKRGIEAKPSKFKRKRVDMPGSFLEWASGVEAERQVGYSIAPGIVTNNIDTLGEGRVQVRIPTLEAFEPFARVCAVGGGSGRGVTWIPQVDDEVLVAFVQNDERDAYILGGLWSTRDRPLLTLFTDFLTKKVIKTGVKNSPLAHEVEFDDARQSIKITSSTNQKITIDPTKIEVQTTGGSLSIKLDLQSQTISISAPVKVEIKATQLSLQGLASVDIKGATINLQATGPCNIQGLPVKIN